MVTKHPLDKCGDNCERVPRSQVKLAEWNPRNPMTPDQRRRLTSVLKKHGLIQPMVVSRLSMTLLSGHQRTSVLDKLSEEDDYLLPVVFVDADEGKEKEICIAMNNADAQSTWDISKLGDMFKGFKLDIEATGFDPGKLKSLIPTVAINIPDVAASLAESKQQWQANAQRSRDKQDAAYNRIAERSETFTPQTGEVAKPETRQEQAILDEDDFFYLVFVYDSLMTAGRVKELMGLPVESRDHDGRVLLQILNEWAEMKGKLKQT
jgi:ParB-like chromosome segregation protein Spo0J